MKCSLALFSYGLIFSRISLLPVVGLLFFISPQAFAQMKNCEDYSKFADVSHKEMMKIVKDKSATVVDVNSPKSFKKSHIPWSGSFYG